MEQPTSPSTYVILNLAYWRSVGCCRCTSLAECHAAYRVSALLTVIYINNILHYRHTCTRTHLPSVATCVAENECRHWLISTASLNLHSIINICVSVLVVVSVVIVVAVVVVVVLAGHQDMPPNQANDTRTQQKEGQRLT